MGSGIYRAPIAEDRPEVVPAVAEESPLPVPVAEEFPSVVPVAED